MKQTYRQTGREKHGPEFFFNFQGTESKQDTTPSLKEKNNGGSTSKQGRARGRKKFQS